MKNILNVFIVLFALIAGVARADECAEFAKEPERYSSIAAGRAALAVAKVCIFGYNSAVYALGKTQSGIEAELKSSPGNASLLRLMNTVVSDKKRFKWLAEEFKKKATRIQRKLEIGSPVIPGNKIEEKHERVSV